MPRVCNQSAVFHAGQVLFIDDIDITGYGNENIAESSSFARGHDTVAVHNSFQCARRIYFGDDDIGTHAMRAGSDTAATPAITKDDKCAASQEDIG